MNRLTAALACTFVALSWAPAMGQQTTDRFQLGGQVTAVNSSEFENTDVGFGALFGWHPSTLIGTEAELNFYPKDLGPDRAEFSSARVEGLFGVTVGPRLGLIRPFAKLRPGFVTFKEAPEPRPCILIFPPPLSCSLAAGTTLFALDIGGGVELFPRARVLFRVDVSDRMVRYPSPVLDKEGTPHEDSFYGHDFRFAAGAHVRF